MEFIFIFIQQQLVEKVRHSSGLTDLRFYASGCQAAVVFRADFNRPNLFYEVRQKPSSEKHLDELCALINGRFSGQSGIIYCFSRKDCEELAMSLSGRGIGAAFYHAYLDSALRTKTHEQWINNKVQVIVATVAFGMGIDKPDVRFVIHHSLAKSIENYYQESGRAGRDGGEAVCILYFRLSDLFRQSTMVCTEKNGLEYLYVMLNYCLQKDVCRRAVFAEMYNIDWNPALCLRKCDICVKTVGCHLVDLAPIWKAMLGFLQEDDSNKVASNRLTGAKLIETIAKKKQFTKQFAEIALGNLLLMQYLEESFHFTPYSIISYVRIAAKSLRFMNDPSHKIEIYLEENAAEEESLVIRKRRRQLNSSSM